MACWNHQINHTGYQEDVVLAAIRSVDRPCWHRSILSELRTWVSRLRPVLPEEVDDVLRFVALSRLKAGHQRAQPLHQRSAMRSLRRSIPSVITLALFAALTCLGSGCRRVSLDPNVPNLGGKSQVANPLIVPMLDRWWVMDQISDELDDYFRIYREERIRIIDAVMTEGWIETHPKIGSTLLEPWHKDSTPGFEKAHATLQTVRRFAKVRVIPTGNSYAVDVKVFKELEDLPQPIGAAVSTPSIRHDNALDVDRRNPWTTTQRAGWIPLGRDVSLEQLILRNVQTRLDQSPVTAADATGFDIPLE